MIAPALISVDQTTEAGGKSMSCLLILDITLCCRVPNTNLFYVCNHRTEILGSGFCADFPHHFPSRLFY